METIKLILYKVYKKQFKHFLYFFSIYNTVKEKMMLEYISDDVDISSNDSDEENSVEENFNEEN